MKNEIALLVNELSTILVEQGGEPVTQAGPVADNTIDEIEKALTVIFPEDYRIFLGTVGAISIADAHFFGIWDKEGKSRSDATVLGETLNLRKNWSLPVFYIPFYRPVYDLYACINCSAIKSEHQIVYFEPARGIYECKHAGTFSEFVENYLKTYIDELK